MRAGMPKGTNKMGRCEFLLMSYCQFPVGISLSGKVSILATKKLFRQQVVLCQFGEPLPPVVGGLVVARIAIQPRQTGSNELTHATQRRRRFAAIYPACLLDARRRALDDLGEFRDGIGADVLAMQPEGASSICERGWCHWWWWW